MNKRIKYISKFFAIAGIIALNVSCTDIDLEANPSDNVALEEGITDLGSATAAVDGMYDLLTLTNYYGRDFMVVPEVTSDNILISTSNSGRFLAEYQYSRLSTTTSVQRFWRDAYRTIGSSNYVLTYADNAKDASAEQLSVIKGHAHAIRALAHFDLLRAYAFPFTTTDTKVAPGADGKGGHLGIPLATVFNDDSFLTKATVAKVYEQIISDLEIAISSLPVAAYSNAPKFNQTGAQALLARVYLYKADYANAYTLADTVIKSGLYSLTSNANYMKDWVGNPTSSEMILQLITSAKDNRGFDSLGSIYTVDGDDGNSGYGDLVPTTDIQNLYTASDVRKGWFRDVKGTIYNYKFPNSWYSNIPVIRLSEMYLIKAEAAANGEGDITEGQNALNAIITRADSNATPTSSTGIALLNEVLLERRKELAFEGHRMFDIVRTKNDLNRTDVATATVIKTITYPDYRMVWPIAQAEIDGNPEVKQNEGY